MKVLRKRVIWFMLVALAGIILFLAGRSGSDSFVSGLGTGITAVALAKLLQFFRIARNPKLLKKFEIEQKEERLIMIAEKSSRFTFLLTVVAELAGIVALILLGRTAVATVVAYVAALQSLVYLISYYYLSKKY
ncbi:MAG: hypothetical protein GX081_10730 [Firmicutes bacterium]|mgnify:CR=1 FL=1|nr:hypothetical protein [Bacillota bacterium]